MKKILLEGLIIIFIGSLLFLAINFRWRDDSQTERDVQILKLHEEFMGFFKQIHGDSSLKSLRFKPNASTKLVELELEVSDTPTLLHSFFGEKDLDREAFHWFYYQFFYSAGEWHGSLQRYQLKYASSFYIDKNEKGRLGNYVVSVSNVRGGEYWVCDYCKIEDFSWLADRYTESGWFDFPNPETALKELAPPSAFVIHKKIEVKLPEFLGKMAILGKEI